MRLTLNLAEVPDIGMDIPAGRYRAKLLKARAYKSENSGQPTMEWTWKLLTGDEGIKGTEVRNWSSLQKHARGSLKQVLVALGRQGEVDEDTDDLIGGKVTLIVKMRKYKNKDTDEVEKRSSVRAVMPPDFPLKAQEEVEEFDDDSEIKELPDDDAESEPPKKKPKKPSKSDDDAEAEESPPPKKKPAKPADDDLDDTPPKKPSKPENRKECEFYDAKTYFCGADGVPEETRCKALYFAEPTECPLAKPKKSKPAAKPSKKPAKDDDDIDVLD